MKSKLTRAMLTSLVRKIIQRGDLEIAFSSGQIEKFGDGSGPRVAVRFADADAPLALLANPELMLGELFMDGRLIVAQGSIYDLLKLVAVNAMRSQPPQIVKIIRMGRDAVKSLKLRNERARAKANVAHHYDLDGRLYDLFLDEDRQYSCAYFEQPDMGLDAAQLAKKRHIAAKLRIEPEQRVLDIGSGWGGMAIYLARHCGARVRGVTLSQEQLVGARTRAQDAGLSDRVAFEIEDYRDTKERFDRIVSVGMFEHVGPLHYDAYFAKIAELLDDDGISLIHTIGRPDGPGSTNPWITKYIFPGGYIPSLSEIAAAVEKSGLFITDIEVLRLHYADTLKAWRARFLARREQAKALYDERFCLMWEFYLALSEIAFRLEGECVFQLQLAKRHDGVPVTRAYIAECEDRLRALDGGRLDAAPEAKQSSS